MKRLFFALWPDDKTRSQISRLSEALTAPAIKKVAPYNYHVTLSFLGAVDAATEARLRQGCDDIQANAFILQFNRIDFWRRPKILCLLAEPVAEVLVLVNQLDRLAESVGIQTETRPYQPHITLARKARQPANRTGFEPIPWFASHFCLLESRHDKDGVRYQVLQTWPIQSETHHSC